MKKGKIRRSRFNIPAILSRWILRMSGWKTVSIPLTSSRYVLIGAHHTSNWDFYIGYLVMTAIGLHMNWVGKHTLFRIPLGWFLKWLGGIPVNRTMSHNFVEQVVGYYHTYQELILAIAPEGTRRHADHWKSGFYHIATQADVPILFGYLDYETKTGGIGGMHKPTGNIQQDMQVIREFYRKVRARFPENAGEIRLRLTGETPTGPDEKGGE